jgi:hypothetical protein
MKLLKEREVEQKNKASGYEVLLKDGIPLNEHFIALKNKFNNEKEELDRFIRDLEDEIRKEKNSNDHKKQRIDILKVEFIEINFKHKSFKDNTTRLLDEIDFKLYNERHTKEILDKEKMQLDCIVEGIKNENYTLDREFT